MGVQAKRCVKPLDVKEKLEWLINSEGPALLEVITDQKVPVLPMVPAGKALHEFLVYDPSKFYFHYRFRLVLCGRIQLT
jgi:acetolactate synthase I/II/III large subunit